MTEPAFALERAMLTALRGAVPPVAGGRIFDVVPPGAAFPYVELGDAQVVPDPAEGLERSVEVYVILHTWSRKPGRPEGRKLCGQIVDILTGLDLDLGASLALALLTHDGTRHLTEADGLTYHGVVTFRALIDPA